uniref:RHS repeat domain-containing protein n=1 Tax=Gynurincola endophyticus TaxID=2479004 RepID=UPI0011D0D405
GDPGNKFKYNGNEEQRKEFSDGSGWETYDFNARTYDAQTGRFIQIDPLSEDGGQESLTPYQFGFNNPAKYNDPDGKCPTCIIGAIIGAAVEYGTQVAVNLSKGKSVYESVTEIDGNAMIISTAAGALSGGVSALVPKSQAAKLLVKGADVLINTAESMATQYNESGSVSFMTTFTDITLGEIGGRVAEKTKIFSENSITFKERQLDRAERIAKGDPNSSGRRKTVTDLTKEVKNKKTTNSVVQISTGAILPTLLEGIGNSIKPEAIPNVIMTLPDHEKKAKDNTSIKNRLPQ